MRALGAVVTAITGGACFLGPEEGCNAGEFAGICAIMQGTVTDATGVPLPGITVGPRYIVDNCCTTNYGSTDTRGTYSFRIARVIGINPEAAQDTVTIYVAAGHPDEGWIDSVLTVVTFAAPSITHEVNLVLTR